MPTPAVILGFILATLYGAVFHLIRGGELRRLALFLLASWLGFGLGQFFGTIGGFKLLSIGQINTFSATLGAWLALLAAHFLTNIPKQPE
ncbi:MAG: hypothetical protein KF716_32035 [Anaerolineae bacterium]|nr:hypothetical protein [Anaerolineae bacterium]